MKDQTYIRGTFPVRHNFNVARLPPHLECFSLVGKNAVLIQSKDLPLCFASGEGSKITCGCPDAQEQDHCDHERALLGGLWAELSLHPQNQPLITCTRAWCEPVLSSQFLPFPAISKQRIHRPAPKEVNRHGN